VGSGVGDVVGAAGEALVAEAVGDPDDLGEPEGRVDPVGLGDTDALGDEGAVGDTGARLEGDAEGLDDGEGVIGGGGDGGGEGSSAFANVGKSAISARASTPPKHALRSMCKRVPESADTADASPPAGRARC
jgi:hypothetical protein